MAKLLIFTTESDAIDYSEKIHKYLRSNRPNYNASKWCDPEQSADGLTWMVKQPIEEEIQKWPVPIDTATEKSKSVGITEQLPEIGEECVKDHYYLYKGSTIKCRQTHNRTIYDPKDTPALFSFFRDNSDSLKWIEGEQVEVGWMRIYNDVKYEVIQAHQTQSDWTPDTALTLWKVWKDPLAIEEWKQPTGAGDAYNIGDNVIFNGHQYESLINANVWSPEVYAAGWKLIN